MARDDANLAMHEAPHGPLTLLIHGKPGVGKTALALEFVYRLARNFPHGPLYADLGYATDSGRLRQLLVAFLRALGDASPSTLPLSQLRQRYLDLTESRRLLFFLDSAKDGTHVEYLLPGGTQCVVIVASRQSLAPRLAPESHSLETLTTDESWLMLATCAGKDAFEQPEYAAEILELCGRLPEAVNSIGKQVAEGDLDLRLMAQRLGREDSRLERVGGAIRGSIASEYEQLTDLERRAFRFLSLTETPTFVPWVLRPLINITYRESETLVAQLEHAQLLELAIPNSEAGGEPAAFGIARYRFHPLFRVYATERLRLEDSQRDVTDALHRLHTAYFEISAKVLAVLEPEIAPEVESLGESKWLSVTSDWPQRMAFGRGDWLQAEYKSVVRAASEAYRRGQFEICWRLGANLGDSVPDNVEGDEVFRAFELCVRAAERQQNLRGVIRVFLAKATMLISLERYGDAFIALQHAESGCVDLRASGVSSQAYGLEATIHRTRAEACMQVGDYANSYKETQEARRLARLAGDELEIDRSNALERELLDLMGAPIQARTRSVGVSGANLWSAALSYRERLHVAETARRQRDAKEAESQLRRALKQNYGDARRAASVRYRLARLFFDQWYLETDETRRNELSVQVVGFSAGALNNFLRMQNPLGCVRARCILVRALSMVERLDGAKHHLDLARRDLDSASQPRQFLEPLHARLLRAEGEYFFSLGSHLEAHDRLDDALTCYQELSDHWAFVDTLRMLGKAELANGDYYAANATFWQLVTLLQKRADTFGLSAVFGDLANTAQAMGHYATAHELRACAESAGTHQHCH